VIDEILSPTVAVPRFRAAKHGLLVFILIAALSAGAWYGRAALLRDAADLWVTSDVPHAADAVAVLGGGLSVRPAAAVDYYRRGLVTKVLISNVAADSVETVGLIPTHTYLNHDVVLKLGVPETAIEIFGANLSNTYQEAVALREWALRAHARSIIVPTQDFSSRRLHWVLERVFAGTGIQVQVPALNSPDYDYNNWWRSEHGVIGFQNEIIKYVYYRLKY
jgi:uncharacterized SAM-binding protein YcdF (DUF218 family)